MDGRIRVPFLKRGGSGLSAVVFPWVLLSQQCLWS